MLSRLLQILGLGRMAHNTLLNSAWQGLRILLQGLWIVIAARLLGAYGYGQLAGLTGLATTLGGLVGLGTGYLLLQNVSRNPASLCSNWRRAILWTCTSGMLMASFFVALSHASVDSRVAWPSLVAIGIAELVCMPLIHVASFAFQARERLGWAGALVSVMSLARLLAAALLWWNSGQATISQYLWLHATVSILSAGFALVSVQLLLRPSDHKSSACHGDTIEGLKYAAAWTTNNATTELDKTLVLQLAGAGASGVYAAAYRLASVLTLPVASLVLAAQPRLFRAAMPGAHDQASSLVPRLLLGSVGYGLLAGGLLLLAAPLLPLLLGTEFEEASKLARWLLALPPLYAIRLLGSSLLMTRGRQMTRIMCEACGAVLLAALAFSFVPTGGATAMALIVTATETTVAIMVWTFVGLGGNPVSHIRPTAD